MKKNSSDRKKKANRQNALRSTGPKTDQGRRKVSKNAQKHGLFSKEVFINKGDGKESRLEFNRMRSDLRVDYQPEGAREEMSFDLIVTHAWRLKRAFRCETGALRLKQDTAIIDQEIERAESHKFQIMLMSSYMFDKNKLRQSSYGVCYLIELLDRANSQLTESGYVTETIHEKLKKCFGKSESSIGGMSSHCVKHDTLDKVLAATAKSNSPECPSKKYELKKQLLRAIRLERSNLNEHLNSVTHIEQLRSEAHLALLNIPAAKLDERILRYISTIERQLYRAIEEYKRLRRERKER